MHMGSEVHLGVAVMPRGGELQPPTGSCSSPPPPEAGRYRPLGAVSTRHSIGAIGLGGLGARRREQSTPISFRPYRAVAAELTSAYLPVALFSCPARDPRFWARVSLPWSAGSDRCGGVELDVKRSTDRNQAGTPGISGRTPGGGLRPGCRILRSVCGRMVGFVGSP